MCIRDSSNTTEAGIAYTQGDSQFDQVPPNSFPAKLTRVLYERYTAFKGAADKGLVDVYKRQCVHSRSPEPMRHPGSCRCCPPGACR